MAKLGNIRWRFWGPCALSGVVAFLSFPPSGLWLLALYAWIPALAWVERHRPTAREAFLGGWLAGTILHLAFYWWLVHTMQKMSGFPWLAAVLVHSLFATVMGLHQAVALWAVRVTQPAVQPGLVGAFLRALSVGAIWASVEFVLPHLFPWYQGNALFQKPEFSQAADIVGIPGVTLACLVVSSLGAQRDVRKTDKKFFWPSIAVEVAFVGCWLAYGLMRIGQVDAAPVEKTLHTLVVQGNATIAEKLAEGKARLPMLARPEKLTRDADLKGVDLVIWPEGTLPFFWVEDSVAAGEPDPPSKPTRAPPILREVKRRVLKLAADIHTPLLTGSLRRPDMLWKEEAHNSAILFKQDGTQQYYDKKILLPFGEYLPGTTWIPALKESIPGVSHMDPGTLSGRMDVAGVKLLVNICYEALYPAFLRAEGPDAEVLVNLTNDIWFGPDPAPTDHLMVQTARPVELRLPLLRSTATGITVYVDAAGRAHEPTALNTEATRRWDVPVKRLESPYRLWGDAPMWGLTLVMTAWIAWHRKRLTSPTA